MRILTGTGYRITAPESTVYSIAGNYIRIQTAAPIQPGAVVVSVLSGVNTLCTLQRFGSDVIFPLDSIYISALGDNNATTITLSVNIGESAISIGAVLVLRAAQPSGAELTIPEEEASFKVPRFMPVYPTLPQTVEVLAYSREESYINSDGTYIGMLSGGKWGKITAPSSSIGNAISITTVPGGIVFLAQITLTIDNCTTGYLVSWQDPDGLRHSYRFPKGAYTTATKNDNEIYSFDTLLRPLLSVNRQASKQIVVSTDLIGVAERMYVDGLLRATDVTLLDLDEWKNNASDPIPVTVAAGEIANNGTPLQRRSFTLNIQTPTL